MGSCEEPQLGPQNDQRVIPHPMALCSVYKGVLRVEKKAEGVGGMFGTDGICLPK